MTIARKKFWLAVSMDIPNRREGRNRNFPLLTTRHSHSLAWHAWQWLMRKIGGR